MNMKPNGKSQLMAIRSGDWKLVTPYAGLEDMDPQAAGFDPMGKVRLYNLAQDIGEAHPVGRDNQKVVAELKAKWNAWAAQMPVLTKEAAGEKTPPKPKPAAAAKQ